MSCFTERPEEWSVKFWNLMRLIERLDVIQGLIETASIAAEKDGWEAPQSITVQYALDMLDKEVKRLRKRRDREREKHLASMRAQLTTSAEAKP